ncbi:drosocin [Drosophila guanche]|uniref:Blast:Drosocin n=1 Tax=Drosophila guanche TaxID=7266 RepID=A0A3B0J2E2_DROGU|nr:drosocin [Drosophila guanche]SPP75285.1 blast:Drosocin [Drosophila guanche]
MKCSLVFLLLACIWALATASPAKPRPKNPRPTSHPRPIRVRREALAIADRLELILPAVTAKSPPILPA